MQYSNFEENPEVRLPSDVCESVREEISSRAAHLTRYNSEFEGSVSSTQNPQSSNPQSPTHSDGTRASTKSTSLPHSAETGIMPLFFFNCHSRFLPYGFLRYLSVGRVFHSNFPCAFAFSGDATGLRGTFPGHPRPFHLTFTDIHNNIHTPMGAFSRRDSNPC
jgi:hypothetical protein